MYNQAMVNPFAAFVYDIKRIPSIAFQNQRNGEDVKLLLRQHPITNIRWALPIALLAFLPFAAQTWGNTFLATLQLPTIVETFTTTEIILLTSTYYLVLIYIGISGLLRWFFNVLLLTNLRVIDLTYRPPFHWQITQAQLEEVQDVSFTQGGILGIIFNYGTIYLQTAGTSQNIMLSKVPQPSRVNELIVGLLP